MSNMTKAELDRLVGRFLAWPLPRSVCADMRSTVHGLTDRSGTELLTADEAAQMFEYVLRGMTMDQAGGEAVAYEFVVSAHCVYIGGHQYLVEPSHPFVQIARDRGDIVDDLYRKVASIGPAPSPPPSPRRAEIVEGLEALLTLFWSAKSKEHFPTVLREAITLLKQGAEVPEAAPKVPG